MGEPILIGIIIGLFLAAIVFTVIDFAINKGEVGKTHKPVIVTIIVAIIGLFLMHNYLS